MAIENGMRRTLSRRVFISTSIIGGVVGIFLDPESLIACDTPITGHGWPSINGWEHRTIMHFLNAIYPGDHGQPLFAGDTYPLRSQGDSSAGAYAACALDVFYDAYYGVTGIQSNALASALDWAVRFQGTATYFYKASLSHQLRAIDSLIGMPWIGSGFQDAVTLALGAALGAFENDHATTAIGWPGPNGGYYDDGKHAPDQWLQPSRITSDGNLG